MKRLLVVAAGLGLVLAVAIIAYEGFGEVTQAFAALFESVLHQNGAQNCFHTTKTHSGLWSRRT